jgi:low molecular weight protein-tyrosine phosphatase
VVRICFVCSGNICRSPTAEIVLNRLASRAGLEGLVRAESAGTGDWHAGDDMDERSRNTLVRAGYDVPLHAAKQFRAADFDDYDVVVALDGGHRRALERLAGQSGDPEQARAKIVMLREYDPLLAAGEEPDVADPYYGDRGGFLEVLEQVERSCAGLLATLRQQTDSPPR